MGSDRSDSPTAVWPEEPERIDLLAEGVEHRLVRDRVDLAVEVRGDRADAASFSGCTASVARHQTIMMTPMTVVAPMIFSAWSLDSWMPLRLTLQK